MSRTEFTLMSHNGTDRVQCYLELPENPRAIFQICHGMCEYFDRYRELIDVLLAAGFAVCGHDHTGHGASVSDEKYFGYFGPKDGAEVLVRDTQAVTRYVKELLPEKPLILLGHSMGSFVVREYITRYGEELLGCILMGTAGPNPALPAGRALSKLLCKLRGDLHRSKLIQKMAFGSYNSKIPDAATPYDWLSRDMEAVMRYADDKRCTFIFTARGFLDMFTLLSRVSRKDWAHRVPVTLPLLVVAGDADPVGAYGKGVQKVYNRLCAAGVRQVKLKLYPEMRHEILNEIGREQVREDILLWLYDLLKIFEAQGTGQP